MNLVARCSERASSALSSTASEKPRENQTRKQNPLSPKTEKYDRPVRPVVCSQQADQIVIENDETNSYTEAESELSLGSRSFLHRRGKNNPCNIGISCIHGKELLRQLAFHQEYKDLTMKQMFDISAKLITEQSDEIYGVSTINWEDSSWKHLSLVGDEQVIRLQHTKVYVFSDSVLYLGKMNENPQSNVEWEDRLTWFKSSPEYRALDRIDGEPMEFEWKHLPRIHHIAAQPQSPRVIVKIERNTREI